MNLIEQLGGYEKAKVEFEAMKQHRELYKGEFDKNDAILLQYRREHNIFEVGDSVVLINGHTDLVHYLSGWYIDGLDFRYTTKPNGWGVIVKSNMPNVWRHATPEEIQAGRRLEVCGG